MKLVIAGKDRTDDIGPELRRPRERAPNTVSPVIGAPCLGCAGSESEYLREFIRLLRYRDAADTRDFDIPRRPGPAGRIMAVLKGMLWKLLRYQHSRIAFQQNLVNRMFTNAIECEHSLRERECRELRDRIIKLEELIAGSSEQT